MSKEKILVIKLSALGDFILSFASFAAIRAQHPAAKITLLTTAPFADLARRSGWFDTVQLDPRPRWYEFCKWLALREKIHAGHYTRVYDLQVNDRTALYHRLFFGGGNTVWSGGAAFRHGDPAHAKTHAFDLRRAQLQQAGIADTPPPDLEWLEGNIAQFHVPDNFVLICAGAAPTRPKKRWPPTAYAALCRHLLQYKLRPVLLGTGHETAINAQIAQLAPGAIDLTGQTNLFDIAALARRAKGAIGNDTGPMHLIAACGCPTLSLFSSDSAPARSRPIGARAEYLYAANLDNLMPDTVIQKLQLR